MNQMAEALLKVQLQTGEVSPLLEQAKLKYTAAEKRREQAIRERALRAVKSAEAASDPVHVYENNLRVTRTVGLGSMLPVTFLRWKPGSPALAFGRPCRIRWGLQCGSNRAVVVSYEYPQPLAGTKLRSTYDLVPAFQLSPCNCEGHIHRIACAPK